MSGNDIVRFGKYRLLSRIAAGGMGEVHLAKQKGPSGFEKLVVIKRLLDHRQREQKYIDMFFSEARVAAQLSHSNIVQIIEVGNYEGIHYIAMEYVRGKSLRTIIDTTQERYGDLPAAYTVQIITHLCAGLSFAHDAHHLSGAPMDLIHRDINPHNVLVSYRGEVKIIDFGIAKSELSMDQTQAGTIKGTVVYMSPEQSSGYKLDKRSDQFSVGICLYEALTGNNPFHKDTLTASLEAIRHAVYPPLVSERPELSPFAPIVSRALAREPEDRFNDCSEMAEQLQRLVDRGIVPKPAVPLSEFLRTLFADDIAEEERMLSQTELAEVPLMGDTETLADTSRTVKSYVPLEADEATVMDNAPKPPNAPNDATLPGSYPPARPTVPHKSSELLWRNGSRPLDESAFYTGRRKLISNIKKLWSKGPARYVTATVALLLTYVLLWFLLRPIPAPDVPHTDLPAPPTQPHATADLPHGNDADGNPNAAAPPPPPQTYQPPPPPSRPTEPRVATPEPEEPRHPGNRSHKQAPTRHPKPHPGRPQETAIEHDPNAGLGMLMLSTEPSAHVTMNGAAVGSTVHLHATAGTLQVGAGTDPISDPFTIHVHFRIEQKNIIYAVESDPWANVFGPGGIPLGRTPLQGIAGGGVTVFEFHNPKVTVAQRVTVRFAPPSDK